MIRIVIEIRGEVEDAQGIKEKLAMDFERYGDVRVVEVQQVGSEQMETGGYEVKGKYCPNCGARMDGGDE